MTTKYSIGDVLVIMDYYNETFASDVISIEIKENEIIYTLSQLQNNKHITVYEEYVANYLYNIVEKVGSISTKKH